MPFIVDALFRDSARKPLRPILITLTEVLALHLPRLDIVAHPPIWCMCLQLVESEYVCELGPHAMQPHSGRRIKSPEEEKRNKEEDEEEKKNLLTPMDVLNVESVHGGCSA